MAGAPVLIPLQSADAVPLPRLTHAAGDDDPGRLLLLLDASGSMKEKDPSGKPKIVGAKRALRDVISTLPDDAEVGLRLYGATVKGKGPRSCKDTQLAVKIGTGNRDALRSAVQGVEPLGETPIAYALQQAAKDLGSSGPRSIVLVSDGEESCVKDACPAARALGKAGIDLKIDVVGLGVDKSTRNQLRCIAVAGKGRYYDAKDATDLSVSVTSATLRAVRPFRFNGEPVQGGKTVASAPDLEPGLYRDTLGPKPAERNYAVKTVPGATYHVNVTMRPEVRTYGAQDGLRLQLLDQDGTVCREQAVQRVSAGRVSSLMVATATSNVSTDRRDAARPCGAPDTLTLRVARDTSSSAASGSPTPFELVVLEEPPVDPGQSLPPGLDDAPPTLVRPAATTTPVVGGSSFSRAATVAPGSWTDTLRPGEVLIYRVRTDWGQRATTTLSALDGDARTRKAAAGVNAVPVDLRSFAPDRQEASPKKPPSQRYAGKGFSLTAASPTARFRNRQLKATGDSDIAGYSYFVVQAGESTSDYVIPVRIDVAVGGQRAGADGPRYLALGQNGTAAGGGGPSTAAPVAPGSDGSAPDQQATGGAGGLGSWLPIALVLVASAGFLVLLVRIGRLDLLVRRIRR